MQKNRKKRMVPTLVIAAVFLVLSGCRGYSQSSTEDSRTAQEAPTPLDGGIQEESSLHSGKEEQELGAFLRKPAIIKAIREKEPVPGFYRVKLSLTDLTGDGTPEVILQYPDNNHARYPFSGTADVYDIHTADCLFTFPFGSDSSNTITGFLDAEGNFKAVIIDYRTIGGSDLHDIVITELTPLKGGEAVQVKYVFAQTGQFTNYSGEERKGDINSGYAIAKDLTRKESEDYYAGTLSFPAKQVSPCEIMDYFASMKRLKSDWREVGSYTGGFCIQEEFEPAAEAVEDIYGPYEVDPEAGDGNQFPAAKEEKKEAADYEKEWRKLCDRLARRSGEQETIVSLADLTGDGSPEVLLTREEEKGKGKTEAYGLKSGKKIVTLDLGNPPEGSLYQLKDLEGGLYTIAANRVSAGKKQESVLYTNMTFQQEKPAVSQDLFRCIRGYGPGNIPRYYYFSKIKKKDSEALRKLRSVKEMEAFFTKGSYSDKLESWIASLPFLSGGKVEWIQIGRMKNGRFQAENTK